MAKRTEVIKVRVSPEIKSQLIQIAAATGSSKSHVIRELAKVTFPHVVKKVPSAEGVSGE